LTVLGANGCDICRDDEPQDGRKSFDGLAAVVASHLARDPLSGGLYVFRNRRGDRLKILISALTGLGDAGPTVTVLPNGNFVVDSPDWNNGEGAVTWVNGTTGLNGTPSAANSLVGSTVFDHVGGLAGAGGGVTALANGNYVVDSPSWGSDGSSNGLGAVTWGNGTTGTSGVVSAANSLVGSNVGDDVGLPSGPTIGVTALTNGNYVVESLYWGGDKGAVTWGNGAIGTTGGNRSRPEGDRCPARNKAEATPGPGFPI
jgi:hypothetical protein